MKTQLTDLDELVQASINADSKALIREAVLSYRAGAYRAAIASTWVATCVDIIEKIRALADTGDEVAQAEAKKINEVGPTDKNAMLRVEGSLLDLAFERFEFISATELRHFKRIREDRNACVHPTFQSDGLYADFSAELTRSHIVNCCRYLLSQQPTVGKAALERIILQVEESSFPAEENAAYNWLSSDRVLGRAKPALKKSVAICLIKQFFTGRTHDVGQRLSVAMVAFKRFDAEIFNDVVAAKLNDVFERCDESVRLNAFQLVAAMPEIWNRLDQGNKTLLIGSIAARTAAEMVDLCVVEAALQVDELYTGVLAYVDAAAGEVKEHIASHAPSALTADYAIDRFLFSGSFNSAYANAMELLLPHAKFLTHEQVKSTLEGVVNNPSGHSINQVLHAGGMQVVLFNFFETTASNQGNVREDWQSFWRQLSDNSKSYFSELGQALNDAGIVDWQPEEEDG